MGKDKGTDPATLAGRVIDGWSYAIDLKGGGTVRLCDHDPPASVWARILAAKEAAYHADRFAVAQSTVGVLPPRLRFDARYVTFSGARSEANGPVDGFGILDAGEILHVRNFGPAVLGAGSVEAKIAELEAKVNADHAILGEVVEQVNEIEAELDAEAGEEGDEEPAPASGAEALAAALAAGDPAEDDEVGVPPHLAIVPGRGGVTVPATAEAVGEGDDEEDEGD